jgi:hypothetical protein
MTALCRSGFFKIKYPNQQANYLIVEPNSDEGVGFVQVFPEKKKLLATIPCIESTKVLASQRVLVVILSYNLIQMLLILEHG